MTLRRYSPMKQSRGTTIPPELRRAVLARDQGQCVMRFLGIEHPCSGSAFLEIDHVRASGALGKKSPTTIDNLVTLCPHGHRVKTAHGRAIRPLLLAYIARTTTDEDTCPHVDRNPSCSVCARRSDPLTLPQVGT